MGSYIPFTCEGKYIEPKFISKITTADDIVVYERPTLKRSIMGEDTAYLMNDLLIEGVKSGTSKRLKDLPYEVAGKTGTVAVKDTNYNTDTYSIAYTTDHIVGVWLGNYTLQKEYNLEGSNNGGTYCTNMVKETLNGIYADYTPKPFNVPDSIVVLDIDEKNLLTNHTVKLASKNCPERYRIKEIFSKRHMPTEVSSIYDDFDINFNVVLNNNIAEITLNALDYLIYDIYVDDKLIKTIENKSGVINFNYDELEQNKMYTFYVDAHTDHSDYIAKSDAVSVYTKNLYEQLIEDNSIVNNDSSLSWYFQ